MSAAPWASGPREILEHGLSLLEHDSDTNRRLAMLSIDNAVELTIKTYLGLPRRVTGINMGRNEFDSIKESFTKLLDALDQYAGEKIAGINLRDIEWYHRLRNELYHQGNGLTVERQKVEIYAGVAQILFQNLFGKDLLPRKDREKDDDLPQLQKEFLLEWADLERTLAKVPEVMEPITGSGAENPLAHLRELALAGFLDEQVIIEIQKLRILRDQLVFLEGDYDKAARSETVEKVKTAKRSVIAALSKFRAQFG
jgi:hypothetical protein